MNKYNGNVQVTKDNQADWAKRLKDVEEISGYVRAYQGATLTLPKLTTVSGYVVADQGATLTLPKLTTVSGYVQLFARLPELEKQLFHYNHKNRFDVNELCTEWMLSQTGNIHYYISRFEFPKCMFDKIRKGQLTAQEVFSIDNVEQRRVAYERMDKVKMKDLKDYKILESKLDNQGNAMQVVSFSIDGYSNPFKYLNCICPSTKREYFIETKQDTCELAKAKSFGMDEIVFNEEV